MASNRKEFALTPVDDADGISASQTPSAGGVQSLTLDGALVVDSKVSIATPHKVIITSVADDSSRTFTVTGLDGSGQPYSEDITGANATNAESSNYFTEVSGITVDNNTAGAVTVGTNGLCSTPLFPLNSRNRCELAFQCLLSAGANLTYSVQHTFDDIQTIGTTINRKDHSTVTAQNSSADGNYDFPPVAIAMAVTAFTSGTATFYINEVR